MINGSSIIVERNKITFINRFAFNEWNKLMNNVMEHMLSDLSEITGIDKKEILRDYINIHDFDVIRETLKKDEKWDTDMDRSLVSKVMKRNNH